MNRFKTLRIRFALWTAGLLLAALLLFGLFVYAGMTRALTRPVDATLRLAALQVLAEIETQTGEPDFVENPLEEPEYSQLRDQGVSLRVLDRDRATVEVYGPYQALPLPTVTFLDPSQPGEYVTATDADSGDRLRVYSLAIGEGDVVGTLQIAQNLTTVRRTLRSLLVTLLVGVPLVVVLAGFGGYFLAARALAPIDKIARTAREISANELATRLNLPDTGDEVSRLAATFDSMLERLDGAFRRERQFTADASHELRTPLAAMQTIIGGTLARPRTPIEYEEALTDLDREAENMRMLTDGLLQLARNDAAGQHARYEAVDLALLLKDVADSLRPVAEEKGLQLVEAVPDAGLEILGDSDGLIRLFVNLLDNSIKYTEQGSITLAAAAHDGGTASVTVSDTGVGIAPEHLLHLFDRFYRVDEARSTQGIGLGLAIAQEIARAHGGSIEVASEPGKGTTFTVHLATGHDQGEQQDDVVDD